MLTATLRRSGGSLIVTIPQVYVEQNHLEGGSLVCIEINRDKLKLKPGRQRPRLAELLAATPPGLCRAEGWDEMPAVQFRKRVRKDGESVSSRAAKRLYPRQ